MPELLVFLQNAWQYNAEPGQSTWLRPQAFKDCVVAHGLEYAEVLDHVMWERALWGSQTGKRLREMLPEGCVTTLSNGRWTSDIKKLYIAESTPLVGSESKSKFPPNPAYIERVIRESLNNPGVLAFASFGSHAQAVASVIEKLGYPASSHVTGPHPAWRLLSHAHCTAIREKLTFALKAEREVLGTPIQGVF